MHTMTEELVPITLHTSIVKKNFYYDSWYNDIVYEYFARILKVCLYNSQPYFKIVRVATRYKSESCLLSIVWNSKNKSL